MSMDNIVGANVTDGHGDLAVKNGDGTYSFLKPLQYPLTLRDCPEIDLSVSLT